MLMTMLKKVSLVICAMMITACASGLKDESFVGTGEFNAQEAAKTRVSLGLTYLKNGNFSQAKFNLDKALEFAPRSGEAHYAMAFYYQQVEELSRAQEYYESAISYSKKDPDVLNSYGAFLCEQGQYSEAKKYFLQAVDDKSYIASAETYENLAICAQNQGLTDDAKTYFIAALNHQPTRASTLLYLAQTYVSEKNWEEAKKAIWKHERNASVSAESLWVSYSIAAGQNNLRSALEYADTMKRLYPEHAHTKAALASLGKFQPTMTVKSKNKPSQDPSASQEALMQSPSAANGESIKVSETTTDNTKISPKNATFHVVQKDENLYRISLIYNVKMRKLLEWNNLSDESHIRVGKKLRVRDPNTNE